MPVSTTMSGTGGSITGRQHRAIELQYVGGGQFMVLGSIGSGIQRGVNAAPGTFATAQVRCRVVVDDCFVPMRSTAS
jgi:hypothetical protein